MENSSIENAVNSKNNSGESDHVIQINSNNEKSLKSSSNDDVPAANDIPVNDKHIGPTHDVSKHDEINKDEKINDTVNQKLMELSEIKFAELNGDLNNKSDENLEESNSLPSDEVVNVNKNKDEVFSSSNNGSVDKIKGKDDGLDSSVRRNDPESAESSQLNNSTVQRETVTNTSCDSEDYHSATDSGKTADKNESTDKTRTNITDEVTSDEVDNTVAKNNAINSEEISESVQTLESDEKSKNSTNEIEPMEVDESLSPVSITENVDDTNKISESTKKSAEQIDTVEESHEDSESLNEINVQKDNTEKNNQNSESLNENIEQKVSSVDETSKNSESTNENTKPSDSNVDNINKNSQSTNEDSSKVDNINENSQSTNEDDDQTSNTVEKLNDDQTLENSQNDNAEDAGSISKISDTDKTEESDNKKDDSTSNSTSNTTSENSENKESTSEDNADPKNTKVLHIDENDEEPDEVMDTSECDPFGQVSESATTEVEEMEVDGTSGSKDGQDNVVEIFTDANAAEENSTGGESATKSAQEKSSTGDSVDQTDDHCIIPDNMSIEAAKTTVAKPKFDITPVRLEKLMDPSKLASSLEKRNERSQDRNDEINHDSESSISSTVTLKRKLHENKLSVKRPRKTSPRQNQVSVDINARDSNACECIRIPEQCPVGDVERSLASHSKILNEEVVDVTPEFDEGVQKTILKDDEGITNPASDESLTKDGGIVHTIIEYGDGFCSPKERATVDIHLTGRCNGTIFDNRNVTFCLGEGSEHSVCVGVEKALEYFKLHEKSKLEIKSNYAFGAAGNKEFQVPPNADVEYEVRLNNFRQPLDAKAFPTMVKTFKEIIDSDCLYVDRTQYLGKLIKADDRCYTLFRPRRFGKTLFLDTVESFFLGEERLFKDLLITKNYPEIKCEPYPVIRMDFSDSGGLTAEKLEDALKDDLTVLADTNGIQLKCHLYQKKFSELIVKMAKKNQTHEKVVILIDECETPLRKCGDEAHHEAVCRIMKNFYTEIKRNVAHVKFCILVGVTNLTASDVFSGFNHITPLNEFGTEFDAIVGFTEEEIKLHFDTVICQLALELKLQPKDVYENIRRRYNGFRFTMSEVTVYNPCSVLLYLRTKGKQKNFFSKSGGSSYFEKQILKDFDFTNSLFQLALIKSIKNEVSNIEVDENVLFGGNTMDCNDDDTWAAMFFQIGLLTIHDYVETSSGSRYQLKFSNLENQSFYLKTMSRTFRKNLDLTSTARAALETIQENDWKRFVQHINTFIAKFPYNILNYEKSTESVFQLIMWIFLDKMGYDVEFEKISISGSADLVGTAKNRSTLIFELKIESNPKNALQQCEKYVQRFLLSNVDVICIGMQFSRISKKIEKFGVSNYDQNGTCTIILPYEKWSAMPLSLVEKTEISHDTRKFRFKLPSEKHGLRLPIGYHFYLSAKINGKLVSRAYTPVNTDIDSGFVDLVIKVYFKDTHPKFPDGGKLSQYIENMAIGDTIDFLGPFGELEYLGRGIFSIRVNSEESPTKVHAKKLAMIAGGTGITPILQLIRYIMKTPEDDTKLSLLFANRTEEDIILRDELDKVARDHSDQFKIWYTVDNPTTEDWKYSFGFVSSEMISTHLYGPENDTLVLMCGSPLMINSACLPNLDKLGYSLEQCFTY